VEAQPSYEEIRRVFYALISKLRGSVDQLENQDAKKRRTEQLDWGVSIFNSAAGQRELEEAFLSAIAFFYRKPAPQRVKIEGVCLSESSGS